jgi:aspartyl protease family protein
MSPTHSSALAVVLWLFAGAASATDVTVVGFFGSKALVSINGGQPRTMSIGQRTPEGVTLVAVEGDTATLEVDGKQRTMKMGQLYATTSRSGNASVTLRADDRGHFVTNGQVNGGAVRFLVDTGATLVSLPAADARRLGINYRNGPSGYINTANGAAPAWKVTLDTVRIGDMTINNVDAVVIENGLPYALLGMTFLNRTEMKRDGETMVLTKRF